ncbi:MAG: TonB-dependent receptor domain-containing protein [Polyangia bacterium]
MTPTRSFRFVAGALALFAASFATPRASAESPAPAAVALTPPQVTKFVAASRPDVTPVEGAAVDLELTIDARGSLTDAKVVGPAGAALDAAALQAVRQFQFQPARRGDRPVAARIRYRYTFEAAPVAAAGPLSGTDGQQGRPAAIAGRLEGRILRRADGLAVAAAIVTLLPDGDDGQGAPLSVLSSEDGAFAFADLAPGAYRVRVEADGFVVAAATETVAAGEATTLVYRLDVAGAKKPRQLDFGATASIVAPPREVTKRTLSEDELLRAAGTRGDALRAVELLPGVARPPGLAGLLIIRGSAPDDSQAFFEGAPVDRIYHFGGLTSFTNPRLLDHIDLYPGNFSARFGRKIGGVIDVGVRDPRTDGYHAVADVNLIDASVLAEGPVGQRGGFAFAAKRSYIDLWFKNVIPAEAVGVTAAPVYDDYQAYYTYRPESGGKLRFMLFGSGDEFVLNLKQPADGDPTLRGSFGQSTAFRRLQATWLRPLGGAVEQEVNVGAGTLANHVNAGSSLGFGLDGYEEFLRAEWRAQLGPHAKLIAGIDAYALQLDVTYVGPIAQAAEGNPANSGPLSSLPTASFKGAFRSARPAAYLEAVVQAGERLTLVPGVRADYFSEIGKGSVNPRLTARLKLGPQTTLKGGAGLFSQPPQYGESVALVGNPGLGLEWAQHYGLGIEQAFGTRASLSVEGFYKRLSHLEVNGAGPNGDPLLVNGGRGRIYGLEVLAKLNPTARAFGFVSYTLSRSQRNDDGSGWRLFDYDQTHILTATGGYRLGGHWDLGATFRLVTGSPHTPTTGSVYDANRDFYTPVFGAVNSARDATFHQLSVRVERSWKFQHWALAAYLDVQNAYNHRSQEGLQYSYDYRQSQPVQGLPILPTLGLRGEL